MVHVKEFADQLKQKVDNKTIMLNVKTSEEVKLKLYCQLAIYKYV